MKKITIWIYRTVDLENIAYADWYFKTKKEATDELKRFNKTIDRSDMIIKAEATFEYDADIDIIINDLETENVFQTDIIAFDSLEIIYKR